MSWWDDVNAYKLVPITTGDGQTYDLKMKFKGGSINPLTATYQYAGKVGSKPKRNSCASPVYDMLFYVPQDDWNTFKDSISDPTNDWLVKHPLYGDLKGLPTAITWDNTKLGDVEFTFQFQQSIPEDFPVKKVDYAGITITKNQQIQTESISQFSNLDLITSEVAKLSTFVDNLEKIYESVLNNDYINAFYDIRQTLIDVDFNSARFMQQMNDILNIASTLTLPSLDITVLAIASISERLNLIDSQNAEILKVDDSTVNLALHKESAGASNMIALTQTVITPNESLNESTGFDVTDAEVVVGEDDYKFKKNVDAAILKVNTIYDDYVNAISEVATENFLPNDTLNNNVNQSILTSIELVPLPQ